MDEGFDIAIEFLLNVVIRYLVNSKERTFDAESMKAYKSPKAFRYFDDGLGEMCGQVSLRSVTMQ